MAKEQKSVSASKANYWSLFKDRNFPLYFVLTLSFFMTIFFRVSASVIMPLEAERLGISASLVGFISSAHFYSYALMQPISGVLHDRHGPVRVVAWGLVLTAASCLLLTLVRTPFTLGVWRLVSGLGVSPMYSATLVFIAFAFPHERYTFYAGINFAVSNLGAMVSVAPLGFAVDRFGIGPVFTALAAISSVMALVLGMKAKEDPLRKKAADGGKSKSLSSLVPGIGRALIFVFRDRRMRALMTLWAASAASLVVFQGLWGAVWFEVAFKVSAASARFWSSLISVGMMVGPLLAGGIVITPERLPITIRKTIALNSVVWFVLLGVVYLACPVWVGGVAALALGAATGLRGIFVLAGVTALTPPEEKGVVFGAMNMIAVFSTILSQWLSGVIIDLFPTARPGVYTEEGYFAAFLLVACVLSLSMLVFRPLGLEPLKAREE